MLGCLLGGWVDGRADGWTSGWMEDHISLAGNNALVEKEQQGRAWFFEMGHLFL